MHQPKNLILAVLLSSAILFGWQYFFPPPPPQTQPIQQEADREDLPNKAPSRELDSTADLPREQRLAESPRIRIDTTRLHGSISLKGARFDDLTLARYHETIDKSSPEVTLLTPSGSAGAYILETGWLPGDDAKNLPGAETLWEADSDVLTVEKPVTLRWDNGQGQVFTKRISIDKGYMFTIEQQVDNSAAEPVTLYPYALINRRYEDAGQKHYGILHEGPLGVTDGTLANIKYKELREDGPVTATNAKGWIGMTDKYWLTALIPPSEATVTANYAYHRQGERDIYQVDYLGSAISVSPGETVSTTSRLFAGAKIVRMLDRYSREQQIPLFDRAVDFGMLYFLTKPIFLALDYLHKVVGNFGLAIMALTVLIKLALFPLANKSFHAMSAMRTLQPKMQSIRERYAHDKMRQNQEIMELYKREKINPMSGCLPLLLQIPIFFALYKVLFVTIEMRHAPFFGWIHDLSAPDPTNLFTLFGVLNWDTPSFLHLGVWPMLMCLTMVVQQKLNPKPTDPVQAAMIGWMPFIFLFLFASFPAGLVIYWTWSNLLSIAQQWIILRRVERKHALKREKQARS